MNRRVLTACVVAALLVPALALAGDPPKPAEPGPWKFGEILSLNLSQSSFSTNWTGGDKGSVVWVAGSASTAERQFTRRFNSASALTLAYGQTSRQQDDPGDPSRRVWTTPDKTTDQILFESTVRWTLDAFVDPYLALRAESQFRDETSPLGALSLNPVRLKESAGIARVLYKGDDRQAMTRLGFGFRQTLARTLLTASPRTTSSSSTNDGGIEWQTDVKQPVLQKKVLWTGSLLVFEPVFFSSASALDQYDRDVAAAVGTIGPHQKVAGYWRTPEMSLQNTFAAQITKSVSVNLVTQWLYRKYDATAKVDNTLPVDQRVVAVERNVRKAGQFKEVLALGFSYRMF